MALVPDVGVLTMSGKGDVMNSTITMKVTVRTWVLHAALPLVFVMLLLGCERAAKRVGFAAARLACTIR